MLDCDTLLVPSVREREHHIASAGRAVKAVCMIRAGQLDTDAFCKREPTLDLLTRLRIAPP
jgi:hypothetical protein